MAYDWALPGAEVVCIDDDWDAGNCPEDFGFRSPVRVPMLNEVLTIATAQRSDIIVGGVALTFHEIGAHCVFAARHFRPLVTHTQEQDVALFAPILCGQPVEAA